jgi:hypothetical protein
MQVVSNTFLIMDESSGRAMARNLNIRTSILGRTPGQRYFPPIEATTG